VPAPDPEEAASTWIPVESPEAGTRPAWLPPGTRPGQPYGPPPGEAYDTPPPGWEHPPYGGAPPPYGTQPPYGYGAPTVHPKPRMPRWAKVVLGVGVAVYVLGAVWQMFSLMILRH
jgi:hypothetical protein